MSVPLFRPHSSLALVAYERPHIRSYLILYLFSSTYPIIFPHQPTHYIHTTYMHSSLALVTYERPHIRSVEDDIADAINISPDTENLSTKAGASSKTNNNSSSSSSSSSIKSYNNNDNDSDEEEFKKFNNNFKNEEEEEDSGDEDERMTRMALYGTATKQDYEEVPDHDPDSTLFDSTLLPPPEPLEPEPPLTAEEQAKRPGAWKSKLEANKDRINLKGASYRIFPTKMHAASKRRMREEKMEKGGEDYDDDDDSYSDESDSESEDDGEKANKKFAFAAPSERPGLDHIQLDRPWLLPSVTHLPVYKLPPRIFYALPAVVIGRFLLGLYPAQKALAVTTITVHKVR
jgi:hypothetical protein